MFPRLFTGVFAVGARCGRNYGLVTEAAPYPGACDTHEVSLVVPDQILIAVFPKLIELNRSAVVLIVFCA